MGIIKLIVNSVETQRDGSSRVGYVIRTDSGANFAKDTNVAREPADMKFITFPIGVNPHALDGLVVHKGELDAWMSSHPGSFNAEKLLRSKLAT